MKDVELTKEMLNSFLKIGDVMEEENNLFSFATATTDRIFLLSEDFNNFEEIEDYLKNSDDWCDVLLTYNRNNKECDIYFLWSDREQREYRLTGKYVGDLRYELEKIIKSEID